MFPISAPSPYGSGYVDRGDGIPDLFPDPMLFDDAFHAIDLPVVVPQGAKMVRVRLYSYSGMAATVIAKLRVYGHTDDTWNVYIAREGTAAEGVNLIADLPIDSNRKIEWALSGVAADGIIVVLGWWI